jgi:hypothetical protein
MNFSVQYRGHLSSCNYACSYCPFAKRTETPAQQERDRESLARFRDWLAGQTAHRWKLLFTPWGEALARAWYRRTLAELTHWPHVETVAVQTNLSCGLKWIDLCCTERLALWATYHPSQTRREKFLTKILHLHARGIRLSVGMVGVPEDLAEMRRVRAALPREIYLWINPLSPRPRPYTVEEIAAFEELDPLFSLTSRRQPSLGKACSAGETSFTVDGAGQMRRCHFVEQTIGNIYDPDWLLALQPRLCPRRFCDCFLGKAQLQAETLAPYFGASLMERIPVSLPS